MARARLRVARDAYKFSVAHMTVFPDGRKERLHGHNYQVELLVELADASFASMIPFDRVKAALAELCASFKERTLIAERNPFLEVVRRTADEVELRLCGQRYVFPAADVLFLPIENATVEDLSDHVAGRLWQTLRGADGMDPVVAIEVTVTESPGQGATAFRGPE